jgi:lipoic acid synthetase
VRTIRDRNPGILVETLIPDFGGGESALGSFLDCHPDVLNHNVETVRRLTQRIRDPRANYGTSLDVLRRTKAIHPSMLTKSGLMVGLSETREEIVETLRDLRDAGCDLLTVGQYLQPTRAHWPVSRYLPPEEFEEIQDLALRMGFLGVASGPRVRSSYRAREHFERAMDRRKGTSTASV